MTLSFSPRMRLLMLVVAALLLWYARDAFNAEPEGNTKTARSKVPATKALRGQSLPTDEVCTTPAGMPARSAFALNAKSNPFMAPPIVVPPQRKVAPPPPPAPVVAAAPVEPPPPKLPYKFMGFFDEPGATPTVFLTLGNTLIHAHAGDTLEGGFKLDSISKRELVFVHIERKITLRLPIDGDIS